MKMMALAFFQRQVALKLKTASSCILTSSTRQVGPSCGSALENLLNRRKLPGDAANRPQETPTSRETRDRHR